MIEHQKTYSTIRLEDVFFKLILYIHNCSNSPWFKVQKKEEKSWLRRTQRFEIPFKSRIEAIHIIISNPCRSTVYI